MREDLDAALVRDFPNLYAQRFGNMMETCMCWGFSCGDGWEPLIRRCSEKLEKIIVDSGTKNETTGEEVCFLTMKKFGTEEPAYTKESLEEHLNKHPWLRKNPTWNEERKSYIMYSNPIWHVCASQVKEKFGTLRFYMAGYLPGMDEPIREAELESAKTCEECGSPGEIRSLPWIRTLCENCLRREG